MVWLDLGKRNFGCGVVAFGLTLARIQAARLRMAWAASAGESYALWQQRNSQPIQQRFLFERAPRHVRPGFPGSESAGGQGGCHDGIRERIASNRKSRGPG